jgi:hypothetical protein
MAWLEATRLLGARDSIAIARQAATRAAIIVVHSVPRVCSAELPAEMRGMLGAASRARNRGPPSRSGSASADGSAASQHAIGNIIVRAAEEG